MKIPKVSIIEAKLQKDYPLVGSKIDIYYWTDVEWLRVGHEHRIPTKFDFEREYKKLPISLSYSNAVALEANLDSVYEIMNIRNPMETEGKQKWITKNLQPHPHTSMSTGDIVKARGEYWIVMPIGWKKLEFR